jgi:hypothetical protein
LALAARIREAWAPFMNAMFSGLKTCPKITDTVVYRGRRALIGQGVGFPGHRAFRVARLRLALSKPSVSSVRYLRGVAVSLPCCAALDALHWPRPGRGERAEDALHARPDRLLVLVDSVKTLS